MLAEMTQDHRHAVENIDTATQLDRTTVENMSKTIADLTLQLRQANMKLAEAQSSIATLTSKLATIGTRPNRSTTSPTGPNGRLQKDGSARATVTKSQRDIAAVTAKLKIRSRDCS